jgi:hypothetical protein
VLPVSVEVSLLVLVTAAEELEDELPVSVAEASSLILDARASAETYAEASALSSFST